jgi:transposase-like protein
MNCPECGDSMTYVRKRRAIFKKGRGRLIQRFKCENKKCLIVSVEKIKEM